MMKRIAVCGNIASGKTTVQKLLQDKGYKVLDSDDVSHEILTVKNKELFDEFKDYDVFENGEFSREKVGKLIFSNKNEKERLEKIMFPQIRKKIIEFFEQNKDEELIFIGIPLLFEAKMEDLFDKIIFVFADDNIRLERLKKRNNYTEEYALTRINSQVRQEEKLHKSDFVIKNNDSLYDLRKHLESVLSKI